MVAVFFYGKYHGFGDGFCGGVGAGGDFYDLELVVADEEAIGEGASGVDGDAHALVILH